MSILLGLPVIIALNNKVSKLERDNETLRNENARLSGDNGRLQGQLEYLRWMAAVTRAGKDAAEAAGGDKDARAEKLQAELSDLRAATARLSGELEWRREAAWLFMGAADGYQDAARRQARAQAAELERAREAARALMGADDAFQEAARRRDRARAEELEAARRALLVVMEAADAYQRAARRELKEKARELDALRGRVDEVGARAAALEAQLGEALARNRELEDGCEVAKAENGVLRSEVERLATDLSAAAALVVEAKEAATSEAFGTDDEKVVEVTDQVEDLTHETTEVEEIQDTDDTTKGENGKHGSEVFIGGHAEI